MCRLHSLQSLLVAALLAVVVAWPSPASAGPWTRSLGGWYTKLGVGGYFANGFRDAQGRFVPGVKYQSLSPSLYTEVGLAKNFEVIAYVPYLLAKNDYSDSPDFPGLEAANAQFLRASGGDTNLALQWSSPWIPIPHAVRFEGKLPFYEIKAPDGVFQEFFPAPGDGQVDMTGWLSIGQSFEVPLFLIGEIGYMHRTDWFLFGSPDPVDDPTLPSLVDVTFVDSIRWFSQAGYKFLDDNFLLFNFQGQWPLQNQRFTKGYAAVAGSGFFSVGKGFAIEAGVAQEVHVLQASKGTTLSLGLSHSK